MQWLCMKLQEITSYKSKCFYPLNFSIRISNILLNNRFKEFCNVKSIKSGEG